MYVCVCVCVCVCGMTFSVCWRERERVCAHVLESSCVPVLFCPDTGEIRLGMKHAVCHLLELGDTRKDLML